MIVISEAFDNGISYFPQDLRDQKILSPLKHFVTTNGLLLALGLFFVCFIPSFTLPLNMYAHYI